MKSQCEKSVLWGASVTESSASDRQGSNFDSCVWRTVSSQSSHHPQEVLLAQFSLYVHKGGLKPDLFHFIYLNSNERICMKLLPEMCHRRKNKPLNVGDDLDYDPDLGSGLRSGLRGGVLQSLLSNLKYFSNTYILVTVIITCLALPLTIYNTYKVALTRQRGCLLIAI